MYNRLSSALRAINKRELLLVVAFFFIATSALTGWLFFNIDTKLYTEGTGDATSGFLWLLYANRDWGYFLSHTTLINYPVGDSLWSPVYITWTLILAPLWLLSHFVSPMAAINAMMYLGFMSGGVAGYYVVKHFTKSWAVALLGGYAITFVPYHMMKGVDHFTNIFSWVFVAILASFLLFWKKQSMLRGVVLAIAIAAACYTDGYFVLLAGVMIGALFIAGCATDLIAGDGWRNTIRKTLRLLGVGAVVLALMFPIVYVQIFAQKQVQSDLANSRDDVSKEVAYYAAKPIDFLLPVSKNIVVGQYDWYKSLLNQKNSRSNDGENSAYIGYVVLGLYAVAVWIVIKSILGRMRKKTMTIDRTLMLAVFAVPLMLVWMIQPEIHIAGIAIRMPSYFLANHVPYWRVLERIFIALHPVIVFSACLGLMHLLRGKRKRTVYIVMATLIGLVGIEYYVAKPTFGYGDMPKAYTWLAAQKDIKAVAEVPIVDRPIEVAGYAVFAQMIHGKPLVNSALAKGDIGLFNPLGTVDNPETVNFLRDRGVDAVIVHARTCISYEWGNLVYQETSTAPPHWIDKNATSICIYKINNSAPVSDHLYADAIRGFAKTDYLDSNGEYWLALMDKTGEIAFTDSKGEKVKTALDGVTFSAQLATIGDYPKKTYAWQLLQDSTVIASGNTGASGTISSSISSTKNLVLKVTLGDGGAVGAGEIGISRVEVTTAPVGNAR